MANREMKDSGVEWIGKIPKHWEVMTLKRSTISVKGGIWGEEEKKDENDIPCVRITDFDRSNYTLLDKDLILRNLPQEKQKDYILNKGDLLIEKSGGGAKTPVGQVVIYNKDYPAIYTNFTAKIEINKQIVSSEYFNYLNATLYNLGITVRSIKQTTGIQNLDLNNYLMEKASFPTIEEQQKIAAFLDEKVAHIDNIIEETKKSIENLKAYKQSLITETVTKGLNPNVEMKDSGIDWIGDIPKYWKIYKIGQIFKEHKEENEGLIEDNLLSLSYGKVKRRDIKSKEGLLPQSFEGYNIIKPGDIVLRMTDLQNDQKSLRVGLCKEKGIITSAYISIRAYNNIYPHYAYYYLHSFDIYKGFYGMGAGVRQGVNFNELKKLDILFPTYDEQKQIAIFLDEKSKTIDSTIEQKEQLITELEAYKKSLIYEYVTGKKEVK